MYRSTNSSTTQFGKQNFVFIFILVSALLNSGSAQTNVTNFTYPILFTHNDGQWNKNILYASLKGSDAACFTRDGVALMHSQSRNTDHAQSKNLRLQETPELKSDLISFRFVNPSKNMKVAAQEKAITVSHFYYGNDQSKWKENVSNYKNLKYENVWKNIDVGYQEHNGRLQQTIIVNPGGKISDVQLSVNNSSNNNRDELIMNDAYQIEYGSRISVPVVMKKNDNTIRFTATKYDPIKPLYLPTEFSTYFGGSDIDYCRSMLVEESGDVVIAGRTLSNDLPIVNAYQSTLLGITSAFIAKYSFDMNAFLYCTYYGAEGGLDVMHICKGIGNSIVMSGPANTDKLPITPTAAIPLPPKLKEGSRFYISQFYDCGTLKYSSYLWNEGTYYGRWLDMTTDNVGAVYFVARSGNYPVPFLTPNAMYSTKDIGTYGIIMKLSPSFESILYASYLGGASFPGGIVVDSKRNIIVFGVTTGYFPPRAPDFYPIVNAFQPDRRGVFDIFLTKIDSTGRQIIFSTYIGGSVWNSIFINTSNLYHDAITTDVNDNIYITGLTRSPDFPLKNPTQNQFKGDIDAFISKFSPSGNLLYSTYLGGLLSDNISSICIDSCGEIIVIGSTTSPDYPLHNSKQFLLGSTNKRFITVIDSTGKNIQFSTIWGHTPGPDINKNYSDHIVYAKGNYIYLACTAFPNDSIPVFNAFQDSLKGPSDAVISRISYPTCDTLANVVRLSNPSSGIATVDTIFVIPRFNYASPKYFNIALRIKNNSRTLSTAKIGGSLNLPSTLQLSQFSRSLNILDSALAPLDSTEIIWNVQIINIPQSDTSITITFSSPTDCSVSLINLQKTIYIKCVDYKINLACSINAIDSLQLNSDRISYLPNPFTINYSLKSLQQGIAKIQYIKLSLSKGLQPLHADDTTRSIAFINSYDSVKFSWQIRALHSRWMHNEFVKIVAIDTNGWEHSLCEKTIIIPPIINEVTCANNIIDTLRYNKTIGSYTPDPYRVIFYLQNHIDTLQTNVETEIDLSQAQHLDLASGETAKKLYPFMSANYKEPFSWNLHVKGIQFETVTDTLIMHYRTAYDTTWRSCEMYVVIEKANITALLSCSIITPDTIKAGVVSLMNNPFRVSFHATNIGIVPAQLQTITLLPFNDPRIYSLDVGAQPVAPIQVGDSVFASWRVQLKSSRFYREHLIRIVVTDTSGAVVIACEKKIVVEPLDGMSCRLMSVDTIKYDESTHSYKPDPVEVTLRLTNKLDTTLTNIDAMIDLSYAEHLALSKNDLPIKSLSAIGERLSDSLKWNLTIKSNAQSNDVDTIVMKYRLSPNEQWRECNFFIVIEAEKKFARSSCNAIGNDSVWYNNPWEKISPNPILVRYTITNVGTMTLSGCNVAIITPEVFSIAIGTDSIQTYNNIISGKSETHEWQLNVNHFFPRDTTVTIKWKWSCAEISQDTTCEHTVIFSTKDVTKLTVTPWIIRFRAKRYDALPNAQTVSLMTPSNNAVPWTTSATMTWLNINPQSGSYPENILLQPNTTSLPIGTYNGKVFFTPSSPYQSTDVQVEYEIYTLTNITDRRLPTAVSLSQNYPNPVSGYTAIGFRLTSRERTTLKIIDLFGREIATIVDEELEEGQHSVSFDASQLQSGIYFIRMTTKGFSAMRVMTVVR